MPTKRELVGLAFAELGIGNWQFDLQPDEIQNAINRMDGMMASWSKHGIRIAYDGTSNDPDTEAGTPDWAQEPILLNVARLIAPGFGKQLSPVSAANAKAAYDDLLSSTVTIPQRRFPSTLPLGSGNRLVSVPGQVNFYSQGGNEVAVGSDSTLGLNP